MALAHCGGCPQTRRSVEDVVLGRGMTSFAGFMKISQCVEIRVSAFSLREYSSVGQKALDRVSTVDGVWTWDTESQGLRTREVNIEMTRSLVRRGK